MLAIVGGGVRLRVTRIMCSARLSCRSPLSVEAVADLPDRMTQRSVRVPVGPGKCCFRVDAAVV